MAGENEPNVERMRMMRGIMGIVAGENEPNVERMRMIRKNLGTRG